MKDRKEHIDFDALIAKKLSGEITSQEDGLLQTWLAGSEENKIQYDLLETIWENTKLEPEVWRPNEIQVNAAWNKVKINISGISNRKIKIKQESPVQKSGGKIISLTTKWAVAASIALVISLYFIIKPGQQDGLQLASSGAVADTLFLADGSEVILAPHSSLAYLDEFDENERAVELKGKAQFKVEGNKRWPFKITTASTIVEVVGTEFVVDQTMDSVFVEVLEGTVWMYQEVQDEKTDPIVVEINKGEKAFITSEIEVPIKLPKEELKSVNLFDFQFEERNVQFVLEEISLKFGVDIEAEDAFKQCIFSAKFTQASLRDILETLEEIYGVETDSIHQKIVITGKGC